MATGEAKNNSYDYSSIGSDYGVRLKFNLDAKDFVHKRIENDLITESISKTKWKFHFHDLLQTSRPVLYNGHYCWNFDAAFLSPVTHIDHLNNVTLSDNYTYCVLIHWRDTTSNSLDPDPNNKTKTKNTSNPPWLNPTKMHKKLHHWRIPLRARIINGYNNEYDGHRASMTATHSQFVDWITLKASTASRSSTIGLRTNYYNEKQVNEKYNSQSARASAITSTDTAVMGAKKVSFIGCNHKLDNNTLYSEWNLVVITGRKQAFDGPDSSFWIGTPQQSIRKMGGIRASVPRSCLYSIGSDANSKETKYCSGKIAKVMIFDGVLSKPDIQRLYSHIFALNTEHIRKVVSKSQKWYSLHGSSSSSSMRRRRRHSSSMHAAKHHLKYPKPKHRHKSTDYMTTASSLPSTSAVSSTTSSPRGLAAPSKSATDPKERSVSFTASSSDEADEDKRPVARVLKKKDSMGSVTPCFSVSSPVHEKLLPQLAADILEQQKMIQEEEEQRKRDDSDAGIIGRFVKNIRQLTTSGGGTSLEEEENADYVEQVIDIEQKKPKYSIDEEEKHTAAEEVKKEVAIKTDSKRSMKGSVKMPPLRDTVQHVVLYETSHRFFLVGSNLQGTKYWILKIDRKSSSTATAGSASMKDERRPNLHIVEDRTVYNKEQITTILSMIGAGNENAGGLTQCISGYGIVGFIRFLEGYYIVLITEREKVGYIGNHEVYKINKTAMIPVSPSRVDSNMTSKRLRSDETRYKNLFSVIDLNREFYFSYSYDLSRTLQWNMCNHFRRKPNHIFVWNEFLLKPLRMATKSNTWMLPIIHGYFESKICSIYGREISLTLISRRSKQFAGTRYLKRGINDLGHSANDIETEQILHDRVGGHFEEGQLTSHVQMRASIPLFWVQDSNPMVPKPDIYIQKVDPSASSIRKHFQSVFKRYGAPILVMNLIKHAESHPRETIVGREFKRAMSFINSFLPKDYKISFVAWDFKDCQRHKARSVVDELTKFAEWSLQRTGFFHSNPTIQALHTFGRRTYDIKEDDVDIQPVRYEDSDELNTGSNTKIGSWHSIPRNVLLRAFKKASPSKRRIYDLGCFQKGVLRSNCIDSLDRTNVAQFIVGKCALGYQLYALGMLDAPWLDRESDFIRVLLQMYERMGDCLALQYGGSQMHRQMKKDHAEARSMAPALYKQRDPGTRPREMFVSFVRHYQNNFQDNVKQDAMNLFLGTFRPDPSVGSYRLWELGSDYYLHNRLVTIHKKLPHTLSQAQDQWWIASVASFNKTFVHCYKHMMLSKQAMPPNKCVKLMSSMCKSIVFNKQQTTIIKHITNSSYLACNKTLQQNNDDDAFFFDAVFPSHRLTVFDEELKLQCNKMETISRTPYYAHSVHALFIDPNDRNQSNDNYEKSKISRITPFLRSKKIKNNKLMIKNEKKMKPRASMSSPSLHGATTLDLRPYVVNISTPTFGTKFDDDDEANNDAPAASAPVSAASTPRPMQYQDEDMHSQHLPSMTLSAIMNSNMHRPQTPAPILQSADEIAAYDDSLTTVATPKQLKHCRQDSILNIAPIPMQFQDDIDPPQLLQQETPQTSDAKMNENEKKRWRGFFNLFQTGTHAAHTTNLPKAVESIPPKAVESIPFNRYGAPDVYYSADQEEENELALPHNIFCDKQHFVTFLNNNYGKYQLSDYVLSTHHSMQQKTRQDYINNVHRIYKTPDIDFPQLEDINECIKSRYAETDVDLTQQDFSAFARLHKTHLNLYQEIQCIDSDNMKKQGYAFYSNLPHNLCMQSMNPKQLPDDNIQ